MYDVVDPVIIMCLNESPRLNEPQPGVPSGSVFGTPHTLGGAGSEDKIIKRQGLVSPLRLGDAVRDVPRT